MTDPFALLLVLALAACSLPPPHRPADPPPYGTDRERGEPGTGYEGGPRGNVRQ